MTSEIVPHMLSFLEINRKHIWRAGRRILLMRPGFRGDVSVADTLRLVLFVDPSSVLKNPHLLSCVDG